MSIQYVEGDATYPEEIAGGFKIVAHVCNDYGGWKRGFAVAVSKRWKEPERYYKNWSTINYGRVVPIFNFELGSIQIVKVEEDIFVANMVAQGGDKSASNPTALRYDYLRVCLGKLAERCKDIGATVHMPKIGTGLGGGDWSVIEKIIEEVLLDRDWETLR